MRELQQNIQNLFNKIRKNRGDVTSEEVENGNATLQQLREIENTVQLLFEAREFIEQKASYNTELQKRYGDAERQAEKNRKQIRYEKKKRQEQETLLARAAKIEKRT